MALDSSCPPAGVNVFLTRLAIRVSAYWTNSAAAAVTKIFCRQFRRTAIDTGKQFIILLSKERWTQIPASDVRCHFISLLWELRGFGQVAEEIPDLRISL